MQAAPPRFALRRLGPVDAAAYRALRLAALRLQPDCFSASFEAEAQHPPAWFAERLEGNLVIGGWTGHTLAGVAGLHFPPSAKLCHKATVWGMYVRPDARGSGLGTALLQRVIAEARDRVEELRLVVVATNTAARRLYRAAGFTEYGTDPRALKLGDAYCDEVLMALRLPPP